MRQRPQAGRVRPGQADAFGDQKVVLGKLTRGRDVAEIGDGHGGIDAPRREAAMKHAESLPSRRGSEEVGVRFGVAPLSEPQPGAALEREWRAEHARWRI